MVLKRLSVERMSVSLVGVALLRSCGSDLVIKQACRPSLASGSMRFTKIVVEDSP